MTVKNKFPLLLADKGIKENRRISIAEVSRNTGIAERTLQAWARNDITRFDTPVIEALCAYFNCSVCELLEYIPE